MDVTRDRRRRHTHGGVSHRLPVRCILDVRELSQLEGEPLDEAIEVGSHFAFRANDYYLGLIDWTDPADPIRRLVVPDPSELLDFGDLDASDEASNTRLAGLQHKYADTVLLLVTDQCAGFCRYCFRKRLFLPGSRETVRDVSAGLDYIRRHHEITDVLLTGGDSLALPTPKLNEILEELAGIPHVHTVRLGSKIPAFNPYRILSDRALHKVLRLRSGTRQNLYVMCHFDHPREFTPAAVEAVHLLNELGVRCVNQCPVTLGVNDDVDVLVELLQTCTDVGCPQYYLFQCRPTAGNARFAMPLARAFSLVSAARSRVSGLSRRARFCLSHATGKIEIVGIDEERIFARYHRAKNTADEGRMLVYERDDEAYWLDQLVPTPLGPGREGIMLAPPTCA